MRRRPRLCACTVHPGCRHTPRHCDLTTVADNLCAPCGARLRNAARRGERALRNRTPQSELAYYERSASRA